jgi:hypothetical protein
VPRYQVWVSRLRTLEVVVQADTEWDAEAHARAQLRASPHAGHGLIRQRSCGRCPTTLPQRRGPAEISPRSRPFSKCSHNRSRQVRQHQPPPGSTSRSTPAPWSRSRSGDHSNRRPHTASTVLSIFMDVRRRAKAYCIGVFSMLGIPANEVERGHRLPNWLPQ